MQEATISLLVTWQTFYVLIGTAAATLTGLMFVVVMHYQTRILLSRLGYHKL